MGQGLDHEVLYSTIRILVLTQTEKHGRFRKDLTLMSLKGSLSLCGEKNRKLGSKEMKLSMGKMTTA